MTEQPLNNPNKTRLIHAGLFVVTLLSTTMAGAEWMTNKLLFFGEETMSWDEFVMGFEFSIPFLLILSVHEFGHYFMAQYHKVKVTLPYYIPLWLGFMASPSIGTMGALIRIKERIQDRKKYFDIGIAGPLAGFAIALVVLVYAFTNLPEPESIYRIHPDYEKFGTSYAEDVYSYEYNVFKHHQAYLEYRVQDSLQYLEEHSSIDGWYLEEFEPYESYESFSMGTTLLFEWMKEWLAEDPSLVPNDFEIMHYPYLFAGFLALFFTSLNLLPIGQLDGGHILYGLVGAKWHRIIARTLFLGFLYYTGLGIFTPFSTSDYMMGEILYLGFLYLCFYKLTPSVQTRLMMALAIYALQMVTVMIFPQIEGDGTLLLFALVLGRFIGVDHPPVIIDRPLDTKRKVLGWFSLFVFVISFSPRPFQMHEIKKTQINEDKSETPTFLSVTNPSPNCTLMDMPNSRALPSIKCINSSEEISVLDRIPSGSKN